MKKLMILLLLSLSLKAGQLGIEEKLGAMVPLDLQFINQDGKKVSLKELMDGKPTMVSFNYYRCAGICSPQLEDMANLVGKLDLTENEDYRVLTVGFADNEKYELAGNKRKNILHAISRKFDADAWNFVITDNNSSAILAKMVGFEYQKIVSSAGIVSYSHPGVLVMISPRGKVTRYLNGINQLPFDVKMALTEAGEGTTGATIAKKILFCVDFDPINKTYVVRWQMIAGFVITALMILFFTYLVISTRRKGKEEVDNYRRREEPKE